MATGPLVPLGFFAGFAALAGGIAWMAHVQNKKRNAAFQLVAQTMGFSYAEICDLDELLGLCGDLPVFGRGHGKKARRMMRGQLAGRDAAIFDYTYTTGSGKSAHTHHQTVLLFPEGGAGLPDFTLAPEHFLHRIGEAFGYQDIDFESHPDFSKKYLLRGADEEAIRRAFTSDVLSLLGDTKGWHLQSQGGKLAVFRDLKYVNPAEVPSYAADALRLTGALRT